ncbi:MAG: 2-hydroxymuconate tautomerase family protein [Kurthia sp.]|nr:2-hydroxymuconate tautomerase family protein [Candidatus Kurthia equi]
MPLIHVGLMSGRTEEKLEELIAELTKTAEKTLNAPRETIRVIVYEVPKANWGIGGVTAKKLGR